MNVSPKQALLQHADPAEPIPKASARTGSIAAPQDLLGAPPDRQIQYTTELAAALQGDDAAFRNADLPVPGSFINTSA